MLPVFLFIFVSSALLRTFFLFSLFHEAQVKLRTLSFHGDSLDRHDCSEASLFLFSPGLPNSLLDGVAIGFTRHQKSSKSLAQFVISCK